MATSYSGSAAAYGEHPSHDLTVPQDGDPILRSDVNDPLSNIADLIDVLWRRFKAWAMTEMTADTTTVGVGSIDSAAGDSGVWVVGTSGSNEGGRTTDGETWVAMDFPASSVVRSIVSDGTRFIAAGHRSGPRFWYALHTDTVWTEGVNPFSPSSGSQGVRHLVWENNLLVAVGGASSDAESVIATSAGGGVPSFTRRYTDATTSRLSRVHWLGDLWVAVGPSGNLVTASSGTGTWTKRTSGTAETLNDCAGFAGKYVVAGSNGTILSSTDGVTWTPRTSQFDTSAINRVVYANGIFVAAGADGKISTSTDGETWTARTGKHGTSTINDLIFDGHYFVAAGNAGTMSRSIDGITWRRVPSGQSTAGVLVRFMGERGQYLYGAASGAISMSRRII